MKGPSIAVLLGKGGSPSEEKAEGEDYGSRDKGGASMDEYRSYLETAFPDEDWSDDKRVKAMRDFVMACMPE